MPICQNGPLLALPDAMFYIVHGLLAVGLFAVGQFAV